MNKDNYHIAFINMDHRTDRLAHMESQLATAGIEANRIRGMHPQEYTGNPDHVRVMMNRTPGAVGCYLSQVRIMKEARAFNRHAIVFEDDCVFCSDFQKRMDYIEAWIAKKEWYDWDVFYLGASVHIPAWWHKPGHRERELESCRCTLGRDAETTDDPHVLRCYGIFATFAYIVNVRSLNKVIDALERIMPRSMGIDWSMIALGTELNQFCFVPGCVKQMTNQSDIGNGITHWDGFLKLNGTFENSAYVFQDRMEDFNPSTFNWGEAQR